MKKAIFYSLIIALFLYSLVNSEAIAEDKKVYTLDEILSLSLEKNPSIAIFRANLEASRGGGVSLGSGGGEGCGGQAAPSGGVSVYT